MSMTFDATLKDMGRESPEGFLATFDRPPTAAVSLMNVDLSTVTASADLVLAPRPGRGKMDFVYEVVRLWERPDGCPLADGIASPS